MKSTPFVKREAAAVPIPREKGPPDEKKRLIYTHARLLARRRAGDGRGVHRAVPERLLAQGHVRGVGPVHLLPWLDRRGLRRALALSG